MLTCIINQGDASYRFRLIITHACGRGLVEELAASTHTARRALLSRMYEPTNTKQARVAGLCLSCGPCTTPIHPSTRLALARGMRRTIGSRSRCPRWRHPIGSSTCRQRMFTFWSCTRETWDRTRVCAAIFPRQAN